MSKSRVWKKAAAQWEQSLPEFCNWWHTYTRPSVPSPTHLWPAKAWSTGLSSLHRPQARYTSLAPEGLEEVYCGMVQLLMHKLKHGNATWTWPLANATIPLCSHLTTVAATKSVKWRSHTVLFSTVLQLSTLYDDIYKGGNKAPAWLGRGHCECRPAGVLGGGTEQVVSCECALILLQAAQPFGKMF